MDNSSMDLEALAAFFEEGIPFNKVLGVKVDSLTPGRVLLRIPYKPMLIGNPMRPALHGGVISSLADAAGGLAVWSTLDPACSLSTIDLRVDYLRPGRDQDLRCSAEIVRSGNRVGVSAMALYHEDPSLLVADARGVYNIKRGND
jgi:uncharacterized protein (TIGR00369 family)